MAQQPAETAAEGKGHRRNRFNRMEWAGAFGDIGTLIPFTIAYITLVGIDPLGILLALGVSNIAIGLFYRTPVPVQPMKAIGAAAIAQPAIFGPNLIWGAGLFTGAFWLLVTVTGAVGWIARVTGRPVVYGIMLGLGLSFALKGSLMMAGDAAAFGLDGGAVLGGWAGPVIAAGSLVVALLLLGSRRLPAMFALLAIGAVAGVVNARGNPELAGQLATIAPEFRLPGFALGSFGFSDLIKGTLLLGLAQIPLTLGNAVIAVTAEHNKLFPQTPVSEVKITATQGLLNLFAPLVGGIPVCHGAGGLAGHARFGARTGGALVILGTLLIGLALFFSGSVSILFSIFPVEVLGVILLLTGIQLATVVRDIGHRNQDIYVMIFTAGLAMWNMGWAFLAGLLLYHALRREVIKL